MIDLGIVIVNYNVRDLLRRCLQTVFASQGGLSLRVCVVDNKSPDDSVAMVRAEFPQVVVIANQENVGFPTANNQGLIALGAQAPTPDARYYLLLNPDTEVAPDTFVTLLVYMDATPDVGVVGPRLRLSSGKLDHACRRGFPTPIDSFYYMMGFSRLFARSRRFTRYNMSAWSEDELTEVDAVTGAFMWVRAATITQVGLLDEQFWMYGEDLDWAKRVKDGGWRNIYNPAATALHVKGASSRQNKRARLEFYRAMLIFYYKHYYQQTRWWLHFFVLLGIALKGGPAIWADIRRGRAILAPAV